MDFRDRGDLLRLVARIQAIEQGDLVKAPVCRELREKLQRCLTGGWLAEPARQPLGTLGGPTGPTGPI